MKHKNLYLLIFGISVIGLAVVQYQYLNIGLNLAQVQFNQKMGQSIRSIKSDLYLENELTYLVGKAMTKDNTGIPMSLDSISDASKYFTAAFLSAKLIENGIKADFSYRILDKDSVVYLSNLKTDRKDTKLLKYPIILGGYLPQTLGKEVIVELSFENINAYFLSQLNGLTIPSLLFLFFIIAVVIWVLRSFYWQQNVITTTNEFINNLTHELKTPVFSIGLATKILDENATPSQKEMISLIRTQNDKLKTHIDKVLQLAGMEKGGHVVILNPLDFHPILIQLSADFSQIAKISGVEFTADIEERPFLILGEQIHLSNAINNLLDNAIKYRKENTKIFLQSRVEKNKLIIQVKDNGIGIKKEDIPKLSKKYFRVSSGNLHDVKGYGLGLHYVKQIIKFHRGTLKIDSELGEGTTVRVQIPLIRD